MEAIIMTSVIHSDNDKSTDNITVTEKSAFLYQFTGWFIALGFPLMASSFMDLTGIPLLSALIYYFIFGIFLRIRLLGRLPYFRIQFAKIKWEALLFGICAVVCSVLYATGFSSLPRFSYGLLINLFVFALLNGSFEHLVWVNIYDLAGYRCKILGVLASTIYVSAIHILFWTRFIPASNINLPAFIVSQTLLLWIPLRIYAKTGDVTLWSIQHIIYNTLAVLIGGFSIGMYLGFSAL